MLMAASSACAEETIRFASEGYYPPLNYFDDGGKLAGFDIDIAQAVCEKMEADCAFAQQDWDDLILGLVDGNYDVIVASMSITEEREKTVSFTIPYYSNMLTFIGGRNSGIRLSDDSLKGKLVGSQRGMVSADYLEEHYGSIVTFRLFDTQDEVYKDLETGKLDLVLVDNLPAYAWLQTDEGKDSKFVGEFIDIDDRIGLAVRKGDDALRQKLNEALIAILEDGAYETINENYFPFSIYL
jgi:polar amino acid transport system substrate-binding protein